MRNPTSKYGKREREREQKLGTKNKVSDFNKGQNNILQAVQD